MLGQRWRAQRSAADPEERGRGQLEHHFLGAEEQRLIEAALARQSRGQHVGGVGEGLHAIEQPHRRVGHIAERKRLWQLGKLLDQRYAVTTARGQHPQQRVSRSRGCEQRVDVAADGGDVQLEAQVLRRARHPRQMLLARKWPAVIQAHDLEHSVAAQQARVGHGDASLGQGHDGTVEAGAGHPGG